MRLIKNILGFIFVFSLFVSCTQKDKYNDYTLFISNNTNQVLEVETFINNVAVNFVSIQSGEKGLECNLFDVRSISYDLCDNLDSIKFTFPNGKGYLCNIGGGESLCFGNEITPWSLNEKFINTTGNIYEFTINQEDYDNAYDLP